MNREERRVRQNETARARYAARHEEFLEKGRIRRELNRDKLREATRAWRAKHPGKSREYYLKNPQKVLFDCARRRAAKNGAAFAITIEDVQIPDVCPVFGTPFVMGGGHGFRDHSPTLDRIENDLGYVPGNVQVISFRANRIKGDATIDELRKLLEYMER